MNSLNVQDFIDTLSKFHKLFDIMRVIDPVTRQVIHYNGDRKDSHQFACYKFWGKGMQSSNCIASRAAEQNDVVIKIECNHNKTFMIIAAPVKLENGEYVVEMVKDITLTEIITETSGKCVKESNIII